jgi:type I restriction enzyme, S subunit
MNYEVLAEVSKIIMGQSPPSSTYNTVGEGLPFFQGKADFGELYPTPRVYCSQPNRIAEPGDILITVRAPVGPTNINVVQSCIGRGLSAIRVGKDLDRDFLLYFLRFYEPELAKAGTGSTFAAISRDDIEAIKIPLPPLTEQKRIASLLARADRLRRLRGVGDNLSASLLQSVFLEMFGDVNYSKWEKSELGDLIECFEAGVNYLPISEGENTSEWRVLKISAVTWGDFDPTESKPIHASIEFDETHIVRQGDLLISRANTTELVGAVSLVKSNPPKVLLPDKLWRIKFRIKSPILPEYTLHVLRQPGLRKIIGDLATGSSGSMKNISMEKAATLPIPIPPVSMQEQFAAVVHRIEAMRARQAESARQAEELFQSLLAKVFSSPEA